MSNEPGNSPDQQSTGSNEIPGPTLSGREKIHQVIFGTETPMGRLFDVILLIVILASIVVVCLETVESIHAEWGWLLLKLEWGFTIFFTIEYLFRLYCVRRPLKYATSFFGVIDLLSFLPNYVGLALAGSAPSFAVIRALRLLRVFRILNLGWFMNEGEDLGRAIMMARAKIVVFLGVVLVAVTIAGTLMYEVENWNSREWSGFTASQSDPDVKEKIVSFSKLLDDSHLSVDDVRVCSELEQTAIEDIRRQLIANNLSADDLLLPEKSKFSSIPQSMYWATVTMTTVGYGDIVPKTTVGKILAAMLILLGYSLIIVPTGFVSAEMIDVKMKIPASGHVCPNCQSEGHPLRAVYCCDCGDPLILDHNH